MVDFAILMHYLCSAFGNQSYFKPFINPNFSMENKNLLPTLCHLCGLKETRNLRSFNYRSVMTRLEGMYHLMNAGGGTGYSPLHEAARMTPGRAAGVIFRTDTRIDLVEGMYLSVNFTVNNTHIIVLPRTKGAEELARIWAYIIRYSAHMDDSHRFVCILIKPRKITPSETRITEIDMDVDQQVFKDTYDAFVAAALTDDETDFDIEYELQGVRSRSNVARERIKRRMQKMGISVLRGKRASIYLRKTPKKCTVDLLRLQKDYPEAFSTCVRDARQYEFITIKFNNPQND